jgi:hypothetical protein
MRVATLEDVQFLVVFLRFLKSNGSSHVGNNQHFAGLTIVDEVFYFASDYYGVFVG